MKNLSFNDCIESYEDGLFYYNKRDLGCADPGALYVSVQEDPKYGGWFYTYFTGEVLLDQGNRISAYRCYRTRDLERYELCGVAGKGCALEVNDDDWAFKYFWAPEVIRCKQDGKYYMYFSAAAREDKETDEYYYGNEDDRWAGLHLGIAVSDTPMGPFKMVNSESYQDGTNLNGDVISRFAPPINFAKKLNIPHQWTAIDVSPFYAADGNFYIYFAKHVDKFHKGIDVYGMKMKDMITPDYSTLTHLTKPCYRTVLQEGDFTTSIPTDRVFDEGGVNEGPFMTYHSGKYYLTYSRYGFGARAYDISQAVSDSPLGPFVKIPHAEGNPVIGLNVTNDFMAGNGHHNFAYAGDEIIAFYHSHTDPIKNSDEQGRFKGRVLSVDKVKFVYNPRLGFDIMQGSGPSASPQPLAEINAKYVNVANKASVSCNAEYGAEYLTDDLFVCHDYAAHMQAVFNRNAEICMEFNSPINLKAVMVYNAYTFEHAFSCVDKIVLTGADGEQYEMTDIPCNERDVCVEGKFMRQGGAAIAVIEPQKVVKVEIFVSKKYFEHPESHWIKISDVKILAQKEN